MIKIGIDPAFRTGGFCICIIEDADVYFKSFKYGFLDFLSWLIHDRPSRAPALYTTCGKLRIKRAEYACPYCGKVQTIISYTANCQSAKGLCVRAKTVLHALYGLKSFQKIRFGV